ncbi:FTR1 family protein [Paenibacillus sp. FSL H8-0537]|uniref:FTR1 family protein n=1 Tax=Paenibacillus sp. FSL H8-0537 TaxID=2921399 RepID=UPI003101AC1F
MFSGSSRYSIGWKWLGIIVILAAMVAGSIGVRPVFAETSSDLDKLLPLVGGALAAASQSDWEQASGHIKEANERWKQLNVKKSDLSADVGSALAHAIVLLDQGDSKPEEAKASLSELAKAINKYVKSVQKDDQSKLSGKEAAKLLLPMATKLLVEIQGEQWGKASADYKTINDNWLTIEPAIRSDNFTVYGKLETAMSMIRIALQAEPPRAEQSETETNAMIQLLNDYRAGKIDAAAVPAEKLGIADLIAIVDKAAKDIAAGNLSEADGQMQAFISKWPSVEGQVQIRSADAYTKIEIQMTAVSGYLLSNPPVPDIAQAVIAEIREILAPMVEETRYTAWDAGMILLREGLEAILVLAALLAYLKKSGNESKRIWVWSGVWVGLLLSAVMAVLLTYAIAQAAAGSAREAIEGIAGLVSVILMITVGNWLHSKANLRSWNSYIDNKMGSAIARGSLWSLFAVSALAIMREGAETTIFYVGMAPSIDPYQMILGIGVTFLLLVAIAFVIIRFSTKLPIRPFFIVASVLIYYLVFRFMGESIHSLQVAAWLPTHAVSEWPTIGFLGIYPTLETALTQLAVLVVIIIMFVWQQARRKA